MKNIVCILHGLTDSPLQDLGGLTPLQKAQTRQLDALAKRGKCLAVKPPDFGGFDTALLSLLGVQDGLDSVTQGALEAYSLGYVLTPNQTAFSVRFASIGDGVVVDVSETLLSDREGKIFCRDLNVAMGTLGWHFLHLKGPNAVLISEHVALTGPLPNTLRNPIKAVGKKWQEVLPSNKENSELLELMQKAYGVLLHHEVNEVKMDLEECPVNGFLLFQGGKKPKLSLSPEAVDFSKVLLYTTSPVSVGVARMLDIETLRWAPEKRKYEHLLSLLGKLDDIFSEKDYLILEIHHLWNSTYQGDLLEKVKGIEWLDRYILKHLKEYCHSHDCQLSILPLKNTDIRLGELTGGDVPAVVFSRKQKGRRSVPFDEELVNKAHFTIPVDKVLAELSAPHPATRGSAP